MTATEPLTSRAIKLARWLDVLLRQLGRTPAFASRAHTLIDRFVAREMWRNNRRVRDTCAPYLELRRAGSGLYRVLLVEESKEGITDPEDFAERGWSAALGALGSARKHNPETSS